MCIFYGKVKAFHGWMCMYFNNIDTIHTNIERNIEKEVYGVQERMGPGSVVVLVEHVQHWQSAHGLSFRLFRPGFVESQSCIWTFASIGFRKLYENVRFGSLEKLRHTQNNKHKM